MASPLEDALIQLAGGDPALEGSLLAGLEFGETLSPSTAVPVLPNTFTEDELSLINQSRGFLAAPGTTGAQQFGLDLLEQQAFTAGDRSADAADLLARTQSFADTAGQTDQELLDLLEVRRAGLEGLTGEELSALRAQGLEGINRSFQTGLNQLGIGLGSRGVRGGVTQALGSQLLNESGRQQRGLELDILLANVAERNQRLNEFENLASQIDADRFGRSQASLELLGGLVPTLESAEFGRGLAAQQAFTEQERAQQEFLTSDQLTRLGQFSDAVDQINTGIFGRQLTNFANQQLQDQNLAGTVFGFGSFGAAQEGARTAEELAQEQLDIARNAPVPTFQFFNPFEGNAGTVVENPFLNNPSSGANTLIGGF